MYKTNDFLEPEVIDGFEVTTKRKKIWETEIDLLQRFDAFCKENDIKYMIAAGTLLGAVRHRGFIPWDDDIDVYVFRKDYERMLKIAPKFFQGKYFFQSYLNEKEYDRPHAQIRNSDTTAIIKGEIQYRKEFNQGIFIDIFVLDVFPENEDQQEKLVKKVVKQKNIIDGFVRYDQFNDHSLLGKMKHFLLKIVGFKRLQKHYDNICSKYSNYNSELVSDFSFWLDRRHIWKKKSWEDLSEYQFEYAKVLGPKDYDYILKEQYNNYNEFIVGNSEHGEVFFDTEKPYTYYLDEGRKELEKYATTEH